jgi:transcriptional regulator with XRE-family HTH domain
MANSINGHEVRMLLSRNLRRLRIRQNLSQLALAVETNLTHNFINDIENGKKWVSPDTIAKLATALKVEPYHFFIPEHKIGEKDAGTLAEYLDDFTDSLQKMVGEIKGRYLRDRDE